MTGLKERYPYYYPFPRTATDYSETSDMNDWPLPPPPAPPPKLQELYRRRPPHNHGQRMGRKAPPPPSSLAGTPPQCLEPWGNRKRRRAHMMYTPYRVNSDDGTSSDAIADTCPHTMPSALAPRSLFRRTRSTGFPSVPTPRYYRRPRLPRHELAYARRPSKLCLPLACQPEPVYRARMPNRKLPRTGQRLVYHHPCCPGVVADDVLCPLLCTTSPGDTFYAPPPHRRSKLISCLSAPKAKHSRHLRRQSRSDEVAAEIQAVSSDLDALLAEYERMFAESSLRLCNSSSERTTGKKRANKKAIPIAVPKPQTLAHLAMVKPRKTDHSKFQQLPAQPSNTGSIVSEAAGNGCNVLDGLLSDLVAGGFVDSTTGKQSEAVKEMYSKLQEQVSDKPESDQLVGFSHVPTSATTVDTIYKPSYTLQDVYSRKKPPEIQLPVNGSTYKVKSNLSNLSKTSKASKNSKDSLLKPMCTLHDQFWTHNPAMTQSRRQSPPSYFTQDETTVKEHPAAQKSASSADATQNKDCVELHNSKSYIVDMIDKALTREMETIAEESATSKQQINIQDQNYTPAQMSVTNEDLVQMEVGKAIDLVNSESACQLNSDLCMKITQTLTDTLLACDNKESEQLSSSKSFMLLPSDEPPYIRQLRQLRWDHLKHIQREMKRLEDIERFLDNCSSGHSMYSNISTASL